MSPTRVVAALAGIAGVTIALFGGTGGDPASASTSAIGSSCAHPWKETFNPFRPDMPIYNAGAQKVIRLKLTGDLERFGTSPVPVNAEHATASLKRSGTRICSFSGKLHAAAHSVHCTHPSFTNRDWDVTNVTGATCNTWETDNGYIEILTATAARKMTS